LGFFSVANFDKFEVDNPFRELLENIKLKNSIDIGYLFFSLMYWMSLIESILK